MLGLMFQNDPGGLDYMNYAALFMASLIGRIVFLAHWSSARNLPLGRTYRIALIRMIWSLACG